MTYQVLARKWRPQDFASVVGQEAIVTALRNALSEKRIAQAYLFSGIRGVGKTTAARVLAKALNCEKPIGSDERPGADPCNDCPVCRDITGGSDMDVQEIDAATYSKVEQVRELTTSLRTGASKSGRYRIVVLDEVHRLSRAAFDALLKIVEEPPPNLVFIFATTEIDAVPVTILSRCQEFQFRRVPSPVLAEYLGRIAEAESIEVSAPSLRMIARAGEGSVRDSVALLDQMATFGGGTISDEDASRLLGGLDAAIFRRLLGAILAGELPEVTAVTREVEVNGWDAHHVYTQFLAYVRDALHLALGGKPEDLDLPVEEAKGLQELLTVGYEQILQISQLLLQSEMIVRRSEYALLAVEIAWLRAAELPKVTRIEDLISGRVKVNVPAEVAQAPAAPARKVQQAPPRREEAPRREEPHREPARQPDPGPPPPQDMDMGPPPQDMDMGPPPRDTRPPDPPKETAPPEDAVPDDTAPRAAPSADPALVERFLELVRTRHQRLAPLFKDARVVVEGENVLFYVDDFARKRLESKASAEQVRAMVSEVWGPDAGFEIRLSKSKGRPATKKKVSAARREESRPAVQENPTVQAVLEIFDGEIQSVNPRTQEN